MYAVEYLARVGLGHVISLFADEDEPGGYERATEAARLADHARARGLLLAAEPPVPRSGPTDGAKWLGMAITWPDRVPGLKTWTGHVTLAGLIRDRLAVIAADKGATPDLFELRGVITGHAGKQRKQTAAKKGTAAGGEPPPVVSAMSGFDPLVCRDSLDVGFNAAELGMDVSFRPAVELLAVVGLEVVPLVSYAARECGFLHGGRAYRFAVEPRSGGYAYRWGELRMAGTGRADDPANYGTPLAAV